MGKRAQCFETSPIWVKKTENEKDSLKATPERASYTQAPIVAGVELIYLVKHLVSFPIPGSLPQAKGCSTFSNGHAQGICAKRGLTAMAVVESLSL